MRPADAFGAGFDPSHEADVAAAGAPTLGGARARASAARRFGISLAAAGWRCARPRRFARAVRGRGDARPTAARLERDAKFRLEVGGTHRGEGLPWV